MPTFQVHIIFIQRNPMVLLLEASDHLEAYRLACEYARAEAIKKMAADFSIQEVLQIDLRGPNGSK